MGARKGQKNKGAGRPPGSVNKATLRGKAAISAFVEGNAGRLNALLDRIAKNDPLEAFKAIMSVVEYHLPKMSRQEITGKDGKDLYPVLTDEQLRDRLQSLISCVDQKRNFEMDNEEGNNNGTNRAEPIQLESRPIEEFDQGTTD